MHDSTYHDGDAPKTEHEGASSMVCVGIPEDDVDHFRAILREQLAGDHELVRDIHAGREPDATLLPDAVARIMFVEDMGRQIGGFFGSGFAQYEG